MATADVIIIGGGISGATTALGLVEEGAGKVLVFDEQLTSQRPSRGNFGLTWFLCKGSNNPVYAKWARMAIQQWPDFARKLEQETGYDLELEWTGGAIHAFGEEQYAAHEKSIKTLREVCGKSGLDYPARMLSRQVFAEMVPDIEVGEDVTGVMYSAEQGHVNPLKLLGAVRCAFQKKGGKYYGNHSVTSILPQKDGTISVKTSKGLYNCGKLVIAAGHGSQRLLTPLGQKLHIYAERGQLMVSERYKRILKIPLLCARQTTDGTFLIGFSTENTAHDNSVTLSTMKNLACNAVRIFPILKKLNWVRSWGALRIMTPDGAPIYSRIPEHENITIMAMHSAVSLAPLKTSAIAPWVLGINEASQIAHFSNERFNV
ncbi:NAD(P)/FAD-dependent oxidoreductase [Desulforhopalus singaporensis]|uniref:Glycine/D-amino acid oxidase n=1 Tax=Desulforhopalus singaporensis TaxID=91360 RepID=A0A1H0R0M6_9BACT|nr:FAD-binding oxidoreductase [Desulforhopalus singaporensis]SDP23122.1 Glycine/D-amino acid oxidase [Desulforhopalus singaporensis]